ncbi:transcription factor 25, partial [Phenoliferia sp. Uapishka_3]
STSLRRGPSFLSQPEPGWSPAAGILTLSSYTGPESQADEGGEWYTYEHSLQYRAAQLKFLEVLQQADGNRLFNVLEESPYHVDTNMQLSEMMVQQGDLGASSTHLSKALYALSAPLPPSFPSGSFRLPYSKIENRAFFTGIARKVSILVKRGTWRTACEWSKIALGAGGETDPVGMLVYIDFLAPKAKQHTWFLSLLTSLPTAYPEMRIESYPGLAYAKALCLRGLEEESSEDDTKSTEALKSAILKFPMVVPLLFATLGGNVPPKLLSHRRAQVDGSFTDNPSYLLSLLSQLYSVRSSPLWKEPPILAWLQKTVASVAPSLDDSSLEDVRTGEKLWGEGPWPKGFAPSGVIRAAYLAGSLSLAIFYSLKSKRSSPFEQTEIPSIRPYLPPSALSGTSYSYDPLPPSRSDLNATFYDDSYLAPLYSTQPRSRRRNPGQPRANQGPGAAAMVAMRAQLAQILGLGGDGGGIPLNDETREELMLELEALAGAGRGEV